MAAPVDPYYTPAHWAVIQAQGAGIVPAGAPVDPYYTPAHWAAARPAWQPDPNGLFGGQQVIGHRAGMYAQAAIDTSGNWNANSRRATESEWPYTARVAATNPRFVWFNDINDQNAANVPALGLTQATPQVQMGLVQPDGATVQQLDLRTVAAPNTSLGNGVGTPVTVTPRDGVFAVPGSGFSVARGDVVKGRIFVDRANDTATVRFPIQGSQSTANDPGTNGASQNVTGTPGTSHVGASVAAWSALAYGALGFVMPFALLGTPAHPITNVLVLGDSVENRSLDSPNQPDFNISYVKRAIHSLAIGGAEITATGLAQGNETLQNLVATLQVTTNARRRILGAGCWSHVFVGQGRNDIQGGRTAAQIIADYTTLFSLIRSSTPAHTKIYLGTLPPYTDATNNRLNASVVDAVLAWQLGGAKSLVDHVFDVGAVFASAFDRQRWPAVALGDPADLIQDGIHPGSAVADVNGHGGHPAGAAVLTANPAYWTV